MNSEKFFYADFYGNVSSGDPVLFSVNSIAFIDGDNIVVKERASCYSSKKEALIAKSLEFSHEGFSKIQRARELSQKAEKEN